MIKFLSVTALICLSYMSCYNVQQANSTTKETVSSNDTCNMNKQITLLKNIILDKKEAICSYFEFPITDPNILTLIEESNKNYNRTTPIDSVLLLENFDIIFLSEFRTALQKVDIDSLILKKHFQTTTIIDSNSSSGTKKTYKLYVQLSDNLLSFKLDVAYYEDGDKSETTFEYLFNVDNCKVKFDRLVIAG